MSFLITLLQIISLPFLIVGSLLFLILLACFVHAYDKRRSRQINAALEQAIRRVTSDQRR